MSHEASDFGPITDYGESMTKQSFKDSCDINKIIKKAQVSGGLSHALKYDSAVYGEFTGVDLLGAYEQVQRAQTIFDDLPSEVRREFDNDAFKFAAYASDPANVERLPELLPAIAEPGDMRWPAPGDEPAPPRTEEVRAARALLAAAASGDEPPGEGGGPDSAEGSAGETSEPPSPAG